MSRPSDGKATPTQPEHHSPRERVPYALQALSIVAVVAMAIVNATIAKEPIPPWIFLSVLGLGIGADPPKFAQMVSTVARALLAGLSDDRRT